MSELLSSVGRIAVLVFIMSSMLMVGVSYTVREIVGPLRHVGGVLKALLANFVLVPALALLVVWLLSLPSSYGIGLFLVACGAGAAFLIKLTSVSEGDLGLAAALLILLMPATALYMPFVLPLVLPEATISPWAIGAPLIWTLLLPLAAGVVVRAIWPTIAGRVRPVLKHTSTVALVVLVLALILANLSGIADMFGSGAILAALMIVAGAFVMGYLLGGPRGKVRKVIGFATAQRNYGAAMVVASQVLEDDLALLMVVVTSVVGMALLFPIAWYLKEEHRSRPSNAREVQEYPDPSEAHYGTESYS